MAQLRGTFLWRKMVLWVGLLLTIANYLSTFDIVGGGGPACTPMLNTKGRVTTVEAYERCIGPSWIPVVVQDGGEWNCKLESAGSMLPKANKVATGGEDAFFTTETNWIGVADGVGGWADYGVNAGIYSRELMANCKALALALKSNGRPSDVLAGAHSRTLSKGSCTAILATVQNKTLHVVNVGDSGFLLIRRGECVARSTPMLHSFNYPLQLSTAKYESPDKYDLDVEKGDVIILGTDGLFDNIFEHTIVEVVMAFVERQCAGPMELAEHLATLAQQASKSKSGESPFSAGARALGIPLQGGKEDDVTVIVALVA